MLQIQQLETRAGQFQLRGIDLAAEAGSYGVLLGPPGSGKSVLVETICGLRKAMAGRILIAGKDATDDDPRDRLVGYVPQDYLLFPTMRVAENITFGLRSRRIDHGTALKQAEWVVDLLRIGHLLQRWPRTLSGGEQQRVALARALAIKPRILLLDEPVSALDEGLREQVCRELRRCQRELGITTIHISHNLEEALAVSDWAAILDHGELLQVGPMAELLRRPRSEKVARFLRAENILEAEATPIAGDASTLAFRGHALRVTGRHSGKVRFMIRPELVRVHGASSDQENAVRARLTEIADRGVYQRLEFDAGETIIAFCMPCEGQPERVVGREYRLVLPAGLIHILGTAVMPTAKP